MRFVFLLAFLFACNSKSENKIIKAELSSPSIAEFKAVTTFEKVGEGIRASTEVSGLMPGAIHGFHIHQHGECVAPDFKSAGDHFNPTNHEHSTPPDANRHVGDLGNLSADENGVAKSVVILKESDGFQFLDLVGKSIILHEKPDDQVTQPSGNSGNRIACGIIKS